MTLPVSLVSSPCGRTHLQLPVLHPAALPPGISVRNTRKSPRRSDPPKVGIERFSAEADDARAHEDRPGCHPGRNVPEARKEGLDDADKLLESALKREAIISTAVESTAAFIRALRRGAEP